jgi:hypothetical protein
MFERIVLVVFLCGIKFARWHDLSDDRLREAVILNKTFFRFESFSHLFIIICKDSSAVLLADVGSLAVICGWIMMLPKQIEQCIIGDNARIKLMRIASAWPRRTSAHLFVRRIGNAAASVTDGSIDHTFNLAEKIFRSPEAAPWQKWLVRSYYSTNESERIMSGK